MTKEQFEQLKIGDHVTGTKNGTLVKILDIQRDRQLVNTGGTWRRRQDIKMPDAAKDNLATRLPAIKQYTFPVHMLKKHGLIQSAILVTVRRAGPDGYVGTLTSLNQAIQLDLPQATFHTVWKNLHTLGLVTMQKIDSKHNRFQLSEESLKLFE